MFEKKKLLFGKKIKSAFKGSKSLKIAKIHFWQKLQKTLFDFKTLFFKRNLKHVLN